MSIRDEELVQRSRALGAHMIERFARDQEGPGAQGRSAVRGLWAGAEIDPRFASARDGLRASAGKRPSLQRRRNHTVVRLAPPLVIRARRSRRRARLLRGGGAGNWSERPANPAAA